MAAFVSSATRYSRWLRQSHIRLAPQCGHRKPWSVPYCSCYCSVWPVDDIGLQKAVALHYLEGERPTPKNLLQHGERHAPWRTVATWYLWRSLDPVVVQY